MPVHGFRYLGLKSGNGDYTLHVENQETLSASVSSGWSDPNGVIQVYGRLRGETVLSVMDNATQEVKTMRIKVTDNYETFRVSVYNNTHPTLNGELFVFLINNKERDAYFFRLNRTGTDYDWLLQAKGTYAFTEEDAQRYLTLTYVTDAEGRFTIAELAPAPHKFLIKDGSRQLFHRLSENLNLGWEDAVTRESPVEPMSLGMKLEEVGTDYKLAGWLEEVFMPEGILK